MRSGAESSSSGSLASRAAGWLALQVFLKDQGLVVLFVLRAIDQRHPSLPHLRLQARDLLLVRPELGAVSRLELGPFVGVMTEPLPERGAGGDVLHPHVDVRLCLR